jgi:hypothetical protein
MVRWRTGAEGRISCIKRDFGCRRTRMDSLTGARTWTGHGIFAHNLTKLAPSPPEPRPTETLTDGHDLIRPPAGNVYYEFFRSK